MLVRKRLCYNKNMKESRGGFTLIEMTLSMIFIGILSVFMVLMIQNTTASYRRGLILNQLNTVGMDLVDDVRMSIQGASTDALYKLCDRIYYNNPGSKSACIGDNGNGLVSVTKYAPVKIGGNYINGDQANSTIPVYGAFCTGTYTYVWNSGYFEQGEDSEAREVVGVNSVALKIEGTGTVYNNFRLLKVYDRERTVCRNANNNQNGGNYVKVENATNSSVPATFVLSSLMVSQDNSSSGNKESVVEILKKNTTSDLVLYDFYMTRPAVSSTRKNLFFAGSFILGTRRGGINIKSSGNSCKPPSDSNPNLEYCAINKFNFAAQAGGN